MRSFFIKSLFILTIIMSQTIYSQNTSVLHDTIVNNKNVKVIADIPITTNAADKNKKYPVFFILDSQEKNIVDIVKSNINYLQNFGKEIPEVLFVRVEIYERADSYFGAGANDLAEILQKTIVHLNKFNAADYHIILGHSNSASFVLNILNNPNFSKLFQVYIAFSPSETINDINIPQQDVSLYLSHGGLGQYENSFKSATIKYKEKINDLKSSTIKMKYDYFPTANHNTIIPLSLYNSINFAFDPWLISNLESNFISDNKYDILKNLQLKYRLLEKITDSVYTISPNEYVYIADLYYKSGDIKKALLITDEALSKCLPEHEDYYKIYFNRALYFFEAGDYRKSKENIIQAKKFITSKTGEYNYAYPMISYYIKFIEIFTTNNGKSEIEKKSHELLQLIKTEKKISNNNLLVNFINKYLNNSKSSL